MKQLQLLALITMVSLGGFPMLRGETTPKVHNQDVDHVLISTMNRPKGEGSYLIKFYKNNNDYICVYFDDKIPVKALLYNSKSCKELALSEVTVRAKFVKAHGKRFTFKEQSMLGPLNSHPDPVLLPPLPK